MSKSYDDILGLQAAFAQAQKSYNEGGIPIGSALVSFADGPNAPKVLAASHNQRIQKNSAILHGETATLEVAGRLYAGVYKNCTMYTTLSPCMMCTGAILLYKIPRVVIGENVNFVGGENLLKNHGVEVVVVDSIECKELMKKFIEEKPDDWNEDIGEP